MTVLAKLRRHGKAAADALNGVHAAVAETRTAIAELHNRIATLERRPHDDATIEAELDRGLEGLAGKGEAALKRLARGLAGDGEVAPLFHLDGDDLASAVAGLLAKPLRAWALETIATVKSGDAGLTEAERSAERKRLEADLLQAELAEEALIREAERMGIAIQRRADQHPAADLAPDSALSVDG